jgi:hypothetical protein
MNRRGIILIVSAAVLCCSTSRASITGASWWDDGDGAVICTTTNWDASTSTLSMSGTQYWAPGHMVGWVGTTGGGDPTLTLGTTINNDSSFAWTAFIVNVYMNNPFTLLPLGVPSSPNSDWNVGSYTPNAGPTVSQYGDYIGTIVYDGGTPIPNDNVSALDFSYQLGFSGSPSYVFTQEMIPVPEPSTVALVAIGGLFLAQYALRRGRSQA